MRSEITEGCVRGRISGSERVQRVVCRILTLSLCSKLFELCVRLFLYPAYFFIPSSSEPALFTAVCQLPL